MWIYIIFWPLAQARALFFLSIEQAYNKISGRGRTFPNLSNDFFFCFALLYKIAHAFVIDVTMDVKGLTPMKEYKFRVSAVNEEGESIPLEGQETIVAKDPFGESGPPRNLDIVDYDQESADLKWDAPRDDGGAEITGYLIEKKDKYGNWVRAHEVPGTQLKCTVPNLVIFSNLTD